LIDCFEGDASALDLLDDLVSGGGPDEGLGVVVVDLDELVDGLDEFVDRGEAASPDGFVGDLAEPAFDEVQPGRAGGDEVEVEPRVLLRGCCLSVLDRRVLAGQE